MRTIKKPILRVRAHYDGAQPLTDAYADVFALLLKQERGEKSSNRTFDGGKPFHYDCFNNQKECDRDAS